MTADLASVKSKPYFRHMGTGTVLEVSFVDFSQQLLAMISRHEYTIKCQGEALLACAAEHRETEDKVLDVLAAYGLEDLYDASIKVTPNVGLALYHVMKDHHNMKQALQQSRHDLSDALNLIDLTIDNSKVDSSIVITKDQHQTAL